MVASRLFCTDTVLIDVVLTVASLPQRAGDVRATSQLITTGGGFNAMSAAARHDVAVRLCGSSGQWSVCHAGLTADLAREGIGVPVEANREVDCGICVVLVEPDAERTFVTTTGAESTVACERPRGTRREGGRLRLGVGLQRDVRRHGRGRTGLAGVTGS